MIIELAALLALLTGADQVASQFLELPCQFLPDSVGHVFTTIVQTDDGKSHLFLVDTGSPESWISPNALGGSSVQGTETKLSLTLQSPASSDSEVVTFKASVDIYGVDSALKQAIRGVSVEGTLGLNAIEHGQLKLDYGQDRVWLRIGHPSKMTAKVVALAMDTSGSLTDVDGEARPNSILAIPLTRTKGGTYTIKANIGGKVAQLTVDTGSEILAIHQRIFSVAAIQALGKSDGMTSKGAYRTICGISPATTIGKLALPWPNLYQDQDDEDDDGVISPTEFGSQIVLLDLRAQTMYVKTGSEDDWCEAALFQFTGLHCRIDGGQVWMVGDGGEKVFGAIKNGQITSIRDVPIQKVMSDMREQLHGSKAARDRLFRLLISQWPDAVDTVLVDSNPMQFKFPRHA